MNKKCINCGSFKTAKLKSYFVGCVAMTILSIPWCFIGIGFLFLIPSLIGSIAYYKKRKLTLCKDCKAEF